MSYTDQVFKACEHAKWTGCADLRDAAGTSLRYDGEYFRVYAGYVDRTTSEPMETAQEVADYYATHVLGRVIWKAERKVPGWTFDGRYLTAAVPGAELSVGPAHPQAGGYYWRADWTDGRRENGVVGDRAAAKRAAEQAVAARVEESAA